MRAGRRDPRDRRGRAHLVHCTAGKDRTGLVIALALPRSVPAR
jgi:protein tyrosine/serine phosphatase